MMDWILHRVKLNYPARVHSSTAVVVSIEMRILLVHCYSEHEQARSVFSRPHGLGDEEVGNRVAGGGRDVLTNRVTQVTETKISNACKYIIETEDHTLGNIMRMWVLWLPLTFRDMLNDPKVTFVGYRVPHPLATNIEMRVGFGLVVTPKVQTSDPAYPPGRAMMESCSRIISLCKELNDDVLVGPVCAFHHRISSRSGQRRWKTMYSGLFLAENKRK